MKTLLLLFIPFLLSAQYKPFTKNKIIGYSILSVAGAIDGMVEGYEFDGRRSFERKYGVNTVGFWGSKSWTQKKVLGQTWDFYHIGDDIRKAGYISGGIVIGIGKKQKFRHYVFDFLISFAISGASKRLGLLWIRN